MKEFFQQWPNWLRWSMAGLIVLAIIPHVAIAFMAGTTRCVGVERTGEVVKARGPECDRLTNVVTTDEQGVRGNAVLEPSS